ncbi:CDP-glucose 4,6-dehydratase [Pelagibacteraceae bacterium]|nr:CDP-glucose 4,6-dehydratase [Pelagibacteraceae bacterium]
MEKINIIPKRNFWKKKRVLITGHTGFKGCWLALWMNFLGAKVYGLAKKPNHKKNLYNFLKDIFVESIFLDIKNFNSFKSKLHKIKPAIIFHLAAQPLVSIGYNSPHKTYLSNFVGTLNLLEILRNMNSVNTVIFVTTDKVYKPYSKKKFFNEKSELGGTDPYSLSKSLSENLINNYYKVFFDKKISFGIARAGNVIGAGDWSNNRLFPDIIRSLFSKKKFLLRNPTHIRPWQYILEPLYGYIKLAESIYNKKKFIVLNFGPDRQNYKNTKTILNLVKKREKINIIINNKTNFKEQKWIFLSNLKAKKILKISPIIKIHDLIKITINDYKKLYNKTANILIESEAIIKRFEKKLCQK